MIWVQIVIVRLLLLMSYIVGVFMNKFFGLTIISLAVSVFGASAMDNRGEGVAVEPIKYPSQKLAYKKAKEQGSADRTRLLRQKRENKENNPVARRNLNSDFELYDADRGEGTFPANKNDL